MKSDEKVKSFVKMVQNPEALGSLASSKPDFPLANMKGVPPLPEEFKTLGDIVNAMKEALPPKTKPQQAKKIKQKLQEVKKHEDEYFQQHPEEKDPSKVSISNLDSKVTSGNDDVDNLTDTIVSLLGKTEVPHDDVEVQQVFEQLKQNPVTKPVAEKIQQLLGNPQTHEKVKALLRDLVSQSPVAKRYAKPQKVQPKTQPNVPSQLHPFVQPSAPTPKLPQVDISPVISPAEEMWKKEGGELKKLWDQMFRLLGGPEFQEKTFKETGMLDILADMPGGASTPSHTVQYDAPMQGPLWENRDDYGQPDDQSELMGIHADLLV